MRPDQGIRGTSLLVLGAMVVLFATSCGPRVESAESGPPATPVTGPPGAEPTTAASVATQPVESTGEGRAVVAQSPVDRRATPRTPAPAPAGTPTPSGGPVGQAKGASVNQVPTLPGPSPMPTPGAAAGVSRGSEVVIASTGTYSGPIGSLSAPYVKGIQLWVTYVNSRGGVNGHPVRLLVYDDGGDPARHRAQKQEAVEQKHAIAFLNQEVLGGAASVDYVESKRVPVIVSAGPETWAAKSPFYFPAATTGDAVYAAVIASPAWIVIPQGKRRLGWLRCVEAQTCVDAERVWSDLAPKLGFEVVYKGSASVAAPDYTAECLAARNARVEVFVVISDPSGLYRLATACARQAYHPTLVISHGTLIDQMERDPRLDGMIAETSAFPYFQTGTPGTDEFQAVAKRYLGEPVTNELVPLGWIAGKVFEKATVNLPESPTSAAVLDGLWSIRDETLGGLTQPLTFTKNQPTQLRTCWWTVLIKDKAWVSPDQYRARCL